MVNEKTEISMQELEPLCKRFPFSELFLVNPELVDGMSINDFYDLQNLFNFLSHNHPELSGRDIDLLRKDFSLGVKLYLGEQEYSNPDEIINHYKMAREELLKTLSNERYTGALKLEDVILIDGVRKHIIPITLRIGGEEKVYHPLSSKPSSSIYCGRNSSQSITHTLQDLISLSYVYPENSQVRSFLLGEGENYRFRLYPGDYSMFSKQNQKNQGVYDTYLEFCKIIREKLAPEIDGRFGKVLEEGRQSQWTGNEEMDSRTLRKMRFEDCIIYLGGSASENMHRLQDTLKNSLWGISAYGKP